MPLAAPRKRRIKARKTGQCNEIVCSCKRFCSGKRAETETKLARQSFIGEMIGLTFYECSPILIAANRRSPGATLLPFVN